MTTFPGPQPSTLLWVSTNGSDATAQRGRIDKPFSTIQAALTAALAGDTLMVAPGTYAENLVIPDKDGLAIVGQDVDTTIVTAAVGRTISWVAGIGASVRSFRLANVTINNSDAASDAIFLDGTNVPNPLTFLEVCSFDRVIVNKSNGGNAINATCIGRLLTLLCNIDASAAATGVRLRNVGRFGATSCSFAAVNGVTPLTAIDAQWERNGALAIPGTGREGYYLANATYVLSNAVVTGQPIFSLDATSTIYGSTTVTGTYFAATAQGPVVRLNGTIGGAIDPGGGYLPPPVAGIGTLTITLPLTAAGVPKMIVDFTGGHFWGTVTLSKGGGGTVRQLVDARHATFYAESAGNISIGALIDLNLRKAAFAQAALVSVGGGAADRDVITVTGSVLALGANAITFAVPLPPSVTTQYQPVFSPTIAAAAMVVVSTARTAAGFTATAVGVGATGDFDIVRTA